MPTAIRAWPCGQPRPGGACPSVRLQQPRQPQQPAREKEHRAGSQEAWTPSLLSHSRAVDAGKFAFCLRASGSPSVKWGGEGLISKLASRYSVQVGLAVGKCWVAESCTSAVTPQLIQWCSFIPSFSKDSPCPRYVPEAVLGAGDKAANDTKSLFCWNPHSSRRRRITNQTKGDRRHVSDWDMCRADNAGRVTDGRSGGRDRLGGWGGPFQELPLQ